MVRTGATLLLLGMLFFLAVSPWDRCEENGNFCAPACHLFCADGCAQVPLAAAAPRFALAGVAAPAAAYRDLAPGRLAFPPELPPPRR